ncbi:hypothetical protein [Sinomicrobium sp. M5D2P17]
MEKKYAYHEYPGLLKISRALKTFCTFREEYLEYQFRSSHHKKIVKAMGYREFKERIFFFSGH